MESAEDLGETYLTLQSDLFILDLNLPGEDGLSLTARIREVYPSVGIIIATARTESMDRTSGYETGADIYLTKPFELPELIAAMTAVARRCQTVPDRGSGSGSLLRLHRRTFVLEGADGGFADLSADEAAILDGLVRAPAFQLEYWQIFELLGLSFDENAKRNLEVRIVRLRKKMARAGLDGESIKVMRNWGYRLVAQLRIE